MHALATSPAAKTFGAEVSSASLTRMPLSTSRPGCLRKLRAGYDPDADDDEVAGDLAPAAVRTAFTAVSPSERLDALAEHHLDAVASVNVAVEGADLGAEDPLVGKLQRVDDGHLKAALAGGCGELAADPARAHDDHATALVQPLAQHVAVGERAQVVDARRASRRRP